MTEQQTSREALRLLLNAVRYSAPPGTQPEIATIALATLLMLQSGTPVISTDGHRVAFESTPASGSFISALSAAARMLSLAYGVPDNVAQRVADQVESLEARTLLGVRDSLPNQRWWTRQRLARSLCHLYGLARGEPSEGAGRAMGNLLARLLSELQPEAKALGFAPGSGLGWSVDTCQSLVDLGRDMKSLRLAGSFATLEEAFLTGVIFEAAFGLSLENGPYEPAQAIEVYEDESVTHVHTLQPNEFDAVLTVWSQPSWGTNRGRTHHNADTELSIALDAVRPGGSLYLIINLETLVNVPLHFTDILLARRDVLAAMLVMPDSWVHRRGNYPDVILVIQPTKPPYLRDKVLIVDGTQIDHPDSDEAIGELLSTTRHAMQTLAEDGAPAGPLVTTINSRRLTRTHYQAALQPELAYEPHGDHEQRVEALQARVVDAYERRVAALQAFNERLAEIQPGSHSADSEAPE